MLFNTAAVLLLAAAARAIQITGPTNTTTWTAGTPQTITWDSVSTDPTTINIVLQVPNSAEVQTEPIANGVAVSAGSYSYTPDALLEGQQFRITFVDPNNNGYLAQSDYFGIDAASTSASGAVSGTSAPVSGASTTASATTSGASATASAPSASGVVSASVASGSIASASGSGAVAIPNASASAHSGASTLIPSIALVGASLLALML